MCIFEDLSSRINTLPLQNAWANRRSRLLLVPNHVSYHAQKIFAHDLLDVVFGIAPLQQSSREIGDHGHVFKPSRNARNPIKVAADTDVLNTRNLYHMVDALGGILNRRMADVEFSLILEVFLGGKVV
jgi:hypothetical protein